MITSNRIAKTYKHAGTYITLNAGDPIIVGERIPDYMRPAITKVENMHGVSGGRVEKSNTVKSGALRFVIDVNGNEFIVSEWDILQLDYNTHYISLRNKS